MYKLEFIHIPKCGGTAIRKMNHPEILCHGHGTTSPKQGMPSFVILRNPVDRFTSSFWMRISDRNSRQQCRKWLSQRKINSPIEFIEWKIKNPDDWEPISQQLELDYHTVDSDPSPINNYFFMPQTTWFNTPNNVLILDHLDRDFRQLRTAYGLSPSEIRRQNVSMNSDRIIYESNHLHWLKIKYSEDFRLWRKWSKLKIKDRIKL